MPTGNDFLDAMNRATTPAGSNSEGSDLPDGFPFKAASEHRVIDSAKEDGVHGATAYDYTTHRKVFTIFRPWTQCNRCQQNIASGTVTLPQDSGDILCPHTNVNEYQDVVNQGLSGKLLLGTEQETVLRDGTIVVSLKWYETKINYKRLRAEKKRLEREVATRTAEDEEG